MTQDMSILPSGVHEKCSLNSCAQDSDIRGVMDTVVEKVEQMSCSKISDLRNSYICNSNELRCRVGQTNNFKGRVEPGVEKSKHRYGNRKARVRHRKHKWKPYHKLTGDERRRLEERISRRAYRTREKMSASGLTLAPYNTTQFLIDDRNFGEPDYDIHHENKIKEDYNSNSSVDYYSSPDDEKEFIQQQFSETYDVVHDAFINDMNKSDLIRELIRLEDEIDNMERSLRIKWGQKKELDVEAEEQKNELDVEAEEQKNELDVEAEIQKIIVFRSEIRKLTNENCELAKINEELQKRLSKFEESE